MVGETYVSLPQRGGGRGKRSASLQGHSDHHPHENVSLLDQHPEGSAVMANDFQDVAVGAAAGVVGRYRTDAEGDACYEYLDHTADIQIHSWGRDLGEAMANAGLAMYNYMTPLSGISIEPSCSREIEAEGHDEQSLLFAFLDELLFIFHTEFLVCKRITVTQLDRSSWCLQACGEGQMFERGKHESGTEVKAITYSNMQIREQPGDAEVFVIVDI